MGVKVSNFMVCNIKFVFKVRVYFVFFLGSCDLDREFLWFVVFVVDVFCCCVIVVVGKFVLGSWGLCVFGFLEGWICEGSGCLREW